MSSTVFAGGSHRSHVSPSTPQVLRLQRPKLSPLYLLGLWLLSDVVCNLLCKLLCLDARLFGDPRPAANPGRAALVSLSGDADAPLGSWAGSQSTAIPLHRYFAPSLQQHRQAAGKLRTYKEPGFEEERVRTAKKRSGGKETERAQRLLKVAPTFLQQVRIVQEKNRYTRELYQQQPRLQQEARAQQRQRSLLQQLAQQPEARQNIVSFERRKRPPQQQPLSQKGQHTVAGEEDHTSENAAYLQTVDGVAPQKAQQQRSHQQREWLLQRRREPVARDYRGSFLATSNFRLRTRGSVERRQAQPAISPGCHLLGENGNGAVDNKTLRRRGILLETESGFDNVVRSKKAPLASRYHSGRIRAQGERAFSLPQRSTPAFRKGGESEVLLETQGKSRGIGTVLAGAGLSTLLGGLSQYQQGPLAAGPPGSSIPTITGIPVGTAGTAAVTPAALAASPAAATVAAVPSTTPITPITPAATPPESSGHNVLPITAGIILGLVLMCFIGGCIFKKMKQKKRR